MLFLSHTAEYKIIFFNLEKSEIEKIVSRNYKRVKYIPKEMKLPPNIPESRVLKSPEFEYYHDIGEILLVKDKIWVFTSTLDKEKRRLVDVYDMKGEYVDNFFIEYPKGFNSISLSLESIAVKDDYLYSIDEDNQGYESIAKYKLLNLNK